VSETNPIYNDGKRVTIGQQDFVVREIRATSVFKYLNKIFRIFRRINEQNPTIDWEALDTRRLTAAVIGNIDDVSDVLGESMIGVIAESCRVEDEKQIGQLVLSEFIELFAEVIMAQEAPIRAFLSQRARLQAWAATLTSA
jgi:hypothetical protein